MVTILLIQLLIEIFVALLGCGHDASAAQGAVGYTQWYGERILGGQLPGWMQYLGNAYALVFDDGLCPA